MSISGFSHLQLGLVGSSCSESAGAIDENHDGHGGGLVGLLGVDIEVETVLVHVCVPAGLGTLRPVVGGVVDGRRV